VVVVGNTESEAEGCRGIVALSVLRPFVITQLSEFVLAHVRVDDCPAVIDVGEAVNEVTSGGVTVAPTVTVTVLADELILPFEHTIEYVVVDVGDTVIVPLVDLSTPPRVHLSAFVLAHVRVDDCPEVIDVGEAVNEVTSGAASAVTVSVRVAEVACPPLPVQVIVCVYVPALIPDGYIFAVLFPPVGVYVPPKLPFQIPVPVQEFAFVEVNETMECCPA
jgi:hypothetical protein